MYKAYDRKIKDFDESFGITNTIVEMCHRIESRPDTNEVVPFYIGDE